MADLFIGLMSGTSMDGVDGVLAEFGGAAPRVLRDASAPLPPALREELMALNTPGQDELHRAWLAGNALMRVYAEVANRLRGDLDRSRIAAIGAHGQTVRHRPQQFDGTGYTIQLAQPALLAELTGIDVVADFRSRDVAAGGQGAPLAPFFHQAVFGRPAHTVGVLNLGGISNLTLLRPGAPMLGFDCGPANALMDHWCGVHQGEPYDADGRWAATGRPVGALLDALLAEPYFALPPPKSTGRDLFNPGWLQSRLPAAQGASPADVQATLAELTARTVANDVKRHAPQVAELVVCGGGAHNGHLMARLGAALPGREVVASDTRGIPPMQVEAAAFAWLARKAVRREALDLKSTTGASGARVLGCIYPA
jgi:anhydro-N-acetylmuramic acid kinase